MTLGILKSTKSYHEKYAISCGELGIPCVVVDGLAPDWLEQVKNTTVDGWLVRPPGEYPELRALYQERLSLMHRNMGLAIYPTLAELELYENKRHLADWLALYGYPHPETRVFADKHSALEHVKRAAFPLVFKSNVGSAALGVRIIKTRRGARRLVNRAFGRLHPSLARGIRPRIRKYGIPVPLAGLAQTHYLIIQHFERIKWEWRIIRLGDSFFGHQKLLKGDFASGSGRAGWEAPPRHLLELVRGLTDRFGFRSVAVDIFETVDDRFLINEVQSLFGSYDDAQMRVDGVPGRYQYRDGEYRFEEGHFNVHNSYKLRVEDFAALLGGNA